MYFHSIFILRERKSLNTTASLPSRHEKYMTWYSYQGVHRIAQCIAVELISLPDVVPGVTDEINAAKQSLQYIFLTFQK